MYFIVTVYIWLLFLISSMIFIVIASLIWAITILFDRNLRALHMFSCFWGTMYIWLNPIWSIRIEGREKIKYGKTYVMISNHQSMLDILVLYRLFKHFKWVSKAELFNAPFVGWNMRLNRYIGVDRGNRSSHAKFLSDCETNIAMGNSILMFPEGTRSQDGSLLPFKEGAFKIALASKVDIVPIVLEGTANALPKHGYFLRSKEKIFVKVLDPVSYDLFASLTPKEAAQKLQDVIASELERIRSKK